MGCRTVSSGNKITNCGSCGEVLLGDAIKVAANLHYHIHCFTCSECGCELVNTGFFTKLAKYYCAEDYHALFGTLCTLCQKYIEGEGLSIQGKGKSYHISCLTCSKCGGRFDEGSRITFEKEQALCDTCKVTGVKTPTTKHLCASCNEVIVGTSIFAMEQEWHINCFTCQECKKPLTGEYMCKDGVPYCEEDYQTLYGQCCNICSEFILGKVLQAGGNSYHTSCLKCYICTQQFEEGQEIFMQDELFWHTDCDETTDNVIEEQKSVAQAEDQSEVSKDEKEDAEKVEAEKEESEKEEGDEEEGEKTPPELVLPGPPDSTPPPDTPLTDILEDQLAGHDNGTLGLCADDTRDRSKSSVSILSDYEDLSVLQEAGREVVYDSDFDELAPEVPVHPVQPRSIPSPEPKQSDSDSQSLTSKKLLSVSESLASSISKPEEDEKEESPPPVPERQSITESAISESGTSVSSVPKGGSVSEPQSTTVESDVESNKVFGDVSDTVVIKENGRGSLTSEQEEEEEEEKHLSVKEILRLAQEKERELMGNAVLVRKNKVDPTISRRYLSTDSENSDRGSEASDPPAKPPRARSKSPVRHNNKPEMIVQPTMKTSGEPDTSPSATLKTLRSVDSPILKLMDEMSKPDDEQVPETATPPPPPNPWKDEPKSCQPNYSVPKTLSKVPLPDSPPAERRPKKPSPPATPNVDTLKLIEDQIEKPKPEVYKETEMDQIRLQAANKVLKVYDEKDVDWASSAARVVDRVVKHALPTDQNGTEPEVQIDYLDYQETYDISILQTQKMRLPHGIDRSQLQNYLAEDQFEAAFHMSSEKFITLPLWKKTNLKKNLHLF